MGNRDLIYILDNSDVPLQQVSSTARRGTKWNNQVEVGDVVNLVIKESGERFGRAVIVEKELLAYRDVLANADHNHVAFKEDTADATIRLQVELEKAYGPLRDESEVFTILHILPMLDRDEDDSAVEIDSNVSSEFKGLFDSEEDEAPTLGEILADIAESGVKKITMANTAGAVSTCTQIEF